jgi:hypothetical protein
MSQPYSHKVHQYKHFRLVGQGINLQQVPQIALLLQVYMHNIWQLLGVT